MSRELQVLRKFYVEVSKMMVHHEVIEGADGETYASVSPAKLYDHVSEVDDYYDPSKQQLDLELTEDMDLANKPA
jgi:hypothetical protein